MSWARQHCNADLETNMSILWNIHKHFNQMTTVKQLLFINIMASIYLINLWDDKSYFGSMCCSADSINDVETTDEWGQDHQRHERLKWENHLLQAVAVLSTARCICLAVQNLWGFVPSFDAHPMHAKETWVCRHSSCISAGDQPPCL